MPTEGNNREAWWSCGQPEIVPVVVNFSLALKYEIENTDRIANAKQYYKTFSSDFKIFFLREHMPFLYMIIQTYKNNDY